MILSYGSPNSEEGTQAITFHYVNLSWNKINNNDNIMIKNAIILSIRRYNDVIKWIFKIRISALNGFLNLKSDQTLWKVKLRILSSSVSAK